MNSGVCLIDRVNSKDTGKKGEVDFAESSMVRYAYRPSPGVDPVMNEQMIWRFTDMNLKKGLLLAFLLTLAAIGWQAYMVLAGISDSLLLAIFCVAGLIELFVLLALIRKNSGERSHGQEKC